MDVIIWINWAVKSIQQEASVEEIRSAARKAGMRTLQEDGMEKAASGLTSAKEALQVTSE